MVKIMTVFFLQFIYVLNFTLYFSFLTVIFWHPFWQKITVFYIFLIAVLYERVRMSECDLRTEKRF